jgi:hypothetical protein
MSRGYTLALAMSLGYYSIVQFIPAIDRQEGKNVGLVIAGNGEVELSFIDHPDVEDSGMLRRFEETLGYILEHEVRITPGAEHRVLDELAHRRFSYFRILEPCRVDLSDSLATTRSALTASLLEPSQSSRFTV